MFFYLVVQLAGSFCICVWLQMVPAPPPVLDEYCDPVDLKKLNVNSDDHDLRGVYMPNHSLDDDYSVPYEVKKIMSGESCFQTEKYV